MGPRPRDQSVLRDKLARSIDQRDQNFERSASDWHASVAFQQQMARRVQAKRAERDHSLRGFCLCLHALTPNGRSDSTTRRGCEQAILLGLLRRVVHKNSPEFTGPSRMSSYILEPRLVACCAGGMGLLDVR